VKRILGFTQKKEVFTGSASLKDEYYYRANAERKKRGVQIPDFFKKSGI